MDPVDCDGVPEKPDGSDESLDKCIGLEVFPSNADVINCTMLGTDQLFESGTDIRILALRCNKVTECKDKIDEEGCGKDDSILFSCLGIGLVLFLIVSIITSKVLSSREVTQRSLPLPAPDAPEQQIRKVLMIQQEKMEERQSQHQQEFGVGLDGETINNLKVMLSVIFSNILIF